MRLGVWKPNLTTMDKDARNAIERATQRARKLLEEDFAAQLEGDFDVHRGGDVAAKAGAHLSPRQALQRERIVAAVEHKRAAGMSAGDAVADYLRDAAFTTLNRFAALKMLEARELVQECITKGEQSAGYREFCGMAPGLPLLPNSAGYRLYIECLFDELSTEVKVLFDRRDPSSVLWPRRATFEQLLEVLNASELAQVWGEDETIGWVYQFFNSDLERRTMREESQVPRNSRELAVRNQFFTPRYVVQFLTDNTLGRIWYEMRGTSTMLSERCAYMVRKPDEVMTPRPKKDPRDIRVLDPACGSGHFLLYAFDLLVTMYEEAHADPQSPKSEATGRTLAEDYIGIDALRKAVPRLALTHNLHGVDIDPRCAQIAQLALWMRAQRALQTAGVQRGARDRITKTKVVAAEPIPGARAMVDEFGATLNPPLLGDLFRRMVDETRHAAELGSLLPIDRTMASVVRRAREQFAADQAEKSTYLPGFAPVGRPGEPDLTGIDDDGFFAEAEHRIVDSLRAYVTNVAATASIRRQLFAEDAVQGIALIELLRAHYDVILMNPPFGYAHETCAEVLDERVTDIDALFVARGVQLLTDGGRLGIITNRTQLMKPALASFRQRCFLGMGNAASSRLTLCADLGQGVLDAMVETAAFVLAKHATFGGEPSAQFLNGLSSPSKEDCIRAITCGDPQVLRSVPLALFAELPDQRISHWLHPWFLKAFSRSTSLGQDQHVAFGLSTTDNFRFLRLRWEVSTDRIATYVPSGVNGWVPLAKGGEYAPYDGDIHLLVDWRKDGAALRAMPGAPIRNAEFYGRPGLTYSKRTASAFAARVLPAGCIAEVNGPMILPREPDSLTSFAALAVSNSRIASYFVDALVAAGDTSIAGSAAKDYIPGVIGLIPIPDEVPTDAAQDVEVAARTRRELDSGDETSADYCGPWSLMVPREERHVLKTRASLARLRRGVLLTRCIRWAWEADRKIEAAYRIPPDVVPELDLAIGLRPQIDGHSSLEAVMKARKLAERPTEELVRDELSRGNTRKDVSKNAHRADRRIELIATLSGASIAEVVDIIQGEWLESDAAVEELSYAFGVLIGRWAKEPSDAASSVRPSFDPIHSVPPVGRGHTAASTSSLGIVTDDEGNAHDLMGALRVLESLDVDVDEIQKSFHNVRQFFAQSYFTWHLDRHSKSRRKAPIYWQLATPSASYSVWLYIHAFTKDTLFRVQNDYAAPKLAHEERRLETMTREFRDNATAAQRKELAAQENFVEELRAFLDEVKRVAPLWNPNLDDGVILNFAPLFRLVPHHKPWQKELKTTWNALCEGQYDWAHLAMHLWPERVVPKCAADRSLAIAHGLEDIFWAEDRDGKWSARKIPTRPIDELVRERTSPAVKTALKSLLDAPAAAAISKKTKKGKAHA